MTTEEKLSEAVFHAVNAYVEQRLLDQQAQIERMAKIIEGLALRLSAVAGRERKVRADT
jgi:hypothetical protein